MIYFATSVHVARYGQSRRFLERVMVDGGDSSIVQPQFNFRHDFFHSPERCGPVRRGQGQRAQERRALSVGPLLGAAHAWARRCLATSRPTPPLPSNSSSPTPRSSIRCLRRAPSSLAAKPPFDVHQQIYNKSTAHAVDNPLPGFQFQQVAGTGANVLFKFDNGSQNNGAVVSFGATGDAERALGVQPSGSLSTGRIGAIFRNASQTTYTSATISYTGEQWRSGGQHLDQRAAIQLYPDLDFAHRHRRHGDGDLL